MGRGAAGALILMSLLPMSTRCAIITLLGEAKVNGHILTVCVCVVLCGLLCYSSQSFLKLVRENMQGSEHEA